MAFYLTKFLNGSVYDPGIEQICTPYCNETKDGPCPIPCFSLCFPTCNQRMYPPILQPPPPPEVITGENYVPPPHKLSLALTVSLTVLATFFLFFSCYAVYKFYRRCSRGRSQRRQDPREDASEEEGQDYFLDEDRLAVINPIWYIRTVGLQPSVISAISVVKYKRGDGLIEGTDCSVCLNEFQEDETLRLLPKCNHAFHVPCIDTWLRSHTNCPLCRAAIVMNASSSRTPPPEQITPNAVEEIRINVPGNDRELGTDGEGEEQFEPTVQIENEHVSRGETESKRHENVVNLDVGIQPIRRSVSEDNLSASMISSVISDVFSSLHNRLDVEKGPNAPKSSVKNQSLSRLEASSSVQRAMQTGSSSTIERSLSCSAKVLLSRYNERSWNSNISR